MELQLLYSHHEKIAMHDTGYDLLAFCYVSAGANR